MKPSGICRNEQKSILSGEKLIGTKESPLNIILELRVKRALVEVDYFLLKGIQQGPIFRDLSICGVRDYVRKALEVEESTLQLILLIQQGFLAELNEQLGSPIIGLKSHHQVLELHVESGLLSRVLVDGDHLKGVQKDEGVELLNPAACIREVVLVSEEQLLGLKDHHEVLFAHTSLEVVGAFECSNFTFFVDNDLVALKLVHYAIASLHVLVLLSHHYQAYVSLWLDLVVLGEHARCDVGILPH